MEWQPTKQDILEYASRQGWPIFSDIRSDHLNDREKAIIDKAVEAAQAFVSEIKNNPGISLILIAHAPLSEVEVGANGQAPKPDTTRTGYGCGKTMLSKIIHHANSHVQYVPSLPGELVVHNLGQYYESREIMGLFDKHNFEMRHTFKEFGNLVIIDDVGREGALKWEKRDASFQLQEKQDRYYTIIDYCYEHKISMVLTSNMTSKNLAEFLGGASWSRLLQMAPRRYRLNMTGIRDMRPFLANGFDGELEQ